MQFSHHLCSATDHDAARSRKGLFTSKSCRRARRRCWQLPSDLSPARLWRCPSSQSSAAAAQATSASLKALCQITLLCEFWQHSLHTFISALCMHRVATVPLAAARMRELALLWPASREETCVFPSWVSNFLWLRKCHFVDQRCTHTCVQLNGSCIMCWQSENQLRAVASNQASVDEKRTALGESGGVAIEACGILVLLRTYVFSAELL